MHNLYPQPELKTKNNMKTISLKTEMELLLVIMKAEMSWDTRSIQTVEKIIDLLGSETPDISAASGGVCLCAVRVVPVRRGGCVHPRVRV